jgi:hypothetical protein
MMPNLPPRHRLADWTPDLGDVDEWLAGLAREGWVPAHRTGADVVINGRPVVRFSLVFRGDDPEAVTRR